MGRYPKHIGQAAFSPDERMTVLFKYRFVKALQISYKIEFLQTSGILKKNCYSFFLHMHTSQLF
jgi:hypothetical protein